MAPSRRKVLKGLGWSTAGLVVVAVGTGWALRPVLPHRGAPSPADASAWLRLSADGLIEVVMPRAEIGQGIAVSLMQIVAEETGFPLDRIAAVSPRTDLLPPTRATVGSDSIKDFGPLLAQAAAALAAVLKQAGSADGRPPRGGWASLAARPRLVDAAAVSQARPVSFSGGARRIVGTAQPTDRIRAIVTGEAPLYADDVRLPGMVFGAALRAPRLGARLVRIDDGAARRLPGYLGLMRIGEQAFLAAETRGALERSIEAVAVDWAGGLARDEDLLAAVDIDRGLADATLDHVEAQGTFAPDERFDIDLRLDVPAAAHAAMEPRTAVARLEGGTLTVWTGTQDVTFVRDTLAREFGLGPDRVVVVGCRVGGGFGGKTICTVEREAALLARALGRPVKVQWTRQDEFREGFHRPPSSHRIRARMSPAGELEAWHHAFRSGHVIFTSAAMGPALQLATSVIGDPGVQRGALPPYAARTSRVAFDDVRLPVHTGPWRGLGAAPNVWAIETAVDQLARVRGEDPLAFRKRIVAPRWPRLGRALDRVAEMSAWSGLRSTPERGYGLACGLYKEMSYAAIVAEVVRETGGFRVSRLWCAHDCGMVVNPDQVRAQVEGNLVWGLGMALHEELTLAGGHVGQAGFADYALPRFSDVPEIMIDLIEGGDPPTGAGETAIVAATPAITSAIGAASGMPVTRLPFRPGRAA